MFGLCYALILIGIGLWVKYTHTIDPLYGVYMTMGILLFVAGQNIITYINLKMVE